MSLICSTVQMYSKGPRSILTRSAATIHSCQEEPVLIASILKALDDKGTNGSINAVERHDFGYALRPIDTLPWDWVD